LRRESETAINNPGMTEIQFKNQPLKSQEQTCPLLTPFDEGSMGTWSFHTLLDEGGLDRLLQKILNGHEAGNGGYSQELT